MSLEIFHVDAFAERPFTGNPAAVCLLPAPRGEAWMQSVADEMNLSETAFLHPEKDGYRLRWFTPTIEVDLCGHATLASAHILWETNRLSRNMTARFHTASGLLTAQWREEWIELDFPAQSVAAVEVPPHLIEALNVVPSFVGRNAMDFLIEVASESDVRDLKPDFASLAKVPARGVIVTSHSDSPQFDFVSRFFAPAAGINEDPVTGSAHCALGPFWQSRLGKDEFTARQISSRGGVVKVRVAGERVALGGKAVTVLRGELYE